ncbi:MAG TPA: DUF1080 domain-containing protein [Candidatus Acidoferrales bacterium]|jgi:hypothetical protein|nr:DUF1080 domain-containing protein [Candidatus Acidoferrales bacterium]
MKNYGRLIGPMLILTAGLFAADNVLTSQEKAKGWVLLFDGKTLDGWDSALPPAAGPGRGQGGGTAGGAPKQAKNPTQPGAAPAVGSSPRTCSTPKGQAPVAGGASHWDIVDGTLSPCGDPAGYLTSKQTYKDFVLTVDFRTGEDTNSGVFIRSPEGASGYEVQIWKAQPAGYNTGSIVATAKTEGEFKFIPDQWNHYEITADGDHLVVILNGTKTLDVRDSKFSAGRIRLQYQKFPIEFKNIKLVAIQH